MKKYLPLLFLLTAGITVAAQKSKLSENKYRINLPDYWKSGNKVWQKLTDKLPEVCGELKDKELCGDNCNPRYTVEFYMTQPWIIDYYPNHISSDVNSTRPTELWEFVTYYNFQCYLLLYDNSTKKLLTKVIVVDTNEVWQLRNRATLLSYAPAGPSRAGLRAYTVNSGTQQLPSTISGPTSQSGQTPFSYINNNKSVLNPQEKDLLAVVDDKFRSL